MTSTKNWLESTRVYLEPIRSYNWTNMKIRNSYELPLNVWPLNWDINNTGKKTYRWRGRRYNTSNDKMSCLDYYQQQNEIWLSFKMISSIVTQDEKSYRCYGQTLNLRIYLFYERTSYAMYFIVCAESESCLCAIYVLMLLSFILPTIKFHRLLPKINDLLIPSRAVLVWISIWFYISHTMSAVFLHVCFWLVVVVYINRFL